MAKLGFDVTGIEEESNNFGVLPAGNYDVVVKEAIVKQTRSKTGYYINFQYQVINNEKYNKRVLFDIVNIKNDSQKAEEIGKARLKRLLSLAGLPLDGSADTEDFIGKTFNCFVKIDKQEGYEDSNKIASFDKSNAEFKKEKTEGNIPESWV